MNNLPNSQKKNMANQRGNKIDDRQLVNAEKKSRFYVCVCVCSKSGYYK